MCIGEARKALRMRHAEQGNGPRLDVVMDGTIPRPQQLVVVQRVRVAAAAHH
jgi:hypothetical protein